MPDADQPAWPVIGTSVTVPDGEDRVPRSASSRAGSDGHVEGDGHGQLGMFTGVSAGQTPSGWL